MAKAGGGSGGGGSVTYATVNEVNTGTETAKAINPDALAGSIFGTFLASIDVIAEDTALTTGDDKYTFVVPAELDGCNLVAVASFVKTVSSSGLPTVQLYHVTKAADILSTALTIDANEHHSKDAATPAVIDGTKDDVAEGDQIRVDVDVAGTETEGLKLFLSFRKP